MTDTNPTSTATAPTGGAMSELHPALIELYGALPRQGPGDDAYTMRAWRMIQNTLPPGPRVLNIGAGTGADTLALIRNTEAHVTAVDIYPQYLEKLRETAALQGLRFQLSTVLKSMDDLGELFETPYDVVWAEGSAYLLGFERALEEWRPGVLPGGYLVISDLVQWDEEAPEELVEYWQDVVPGVGSIPERLAQAKDAGYKIIKAMDLPIAAWWDPFFYPMEDKLEELREKYKGDKDALAALDSAEKEMDMFEEDPEAFGFTMFILRRPPEPPGKKKSKKKKKPAEKKA